MKAKSVVLWVLQGLLAALFLFAGVMKFVMPVAEMTEQSHLPGWFFHFLGAAEILGALGLVLPGVTRIAPWLTPLAASGLAIIMIGAVAMTISATPTQAIFPVVIGVIAAAIAWGRFRVAPHSSRTRT